MKNILLILFLAISFKAVAQKRNPNNKAIFLEDISWTTAKQVLTSDAVIVIPLGAGAKEHGPHLPLSSDFIQAEGYKNQLALKRKVIITPTINYGYYFGFLKYAGSTSLSFSTATDLVLQIVRSLTNYGPKRFYIINVGVSTTPTLETAAKILANEGVLLYFSSFERPNFAKVQEQLRTQAYGTHADEKETSNILSLRPDLVDMSKAVNDSSMKNKIGGMTPIPLEGGILNTSGIIGYAALGTKEKGLKFMDAFTKEVIKEIDSITTCTLPQVKDRSTEYKKYEGTYTDTSGKKLIINQKDNILYYIWNGRDGRNFFHLYRDGEDFFSSIAFNILFVKNENGEVIKAWCQYRGTSFWVTKMK
ncbi:MAG TPA: creatininase family protein [Chitinophagaceae bacterium]|nr:creatininase family protein [Chitinophagaceae bacterium]